MSHHISNEIVQRANSDNMISWRTPNALNSNAITSEIVSGYVLGFASLQITDSNITNDGFDNIEVANGSWYEINGRITIKDNTTDDKNMTCFLFRNEDLTPVKEWYFHFTQGDTTYRYFQMALNGYIYLDANKTYKWFITGDGGYIHPDQTEIYMKKLNTSHPS